MCRVRVAALAVVLASSAIGQVNAQSLRVSPVTIDLPVSERSAVITVANPSGKPLQVQARVFRWTQKGGQDVLEKTADVVVSPPLLTVNKDAEGIVRVLRVSNAPVTGEETYRVLLDEVPSREKLQAGGVALVVRQSIPVFFAGLDVKPGSVEWRLRHDSGKTVLEAVNPGEKRVRLAKLKVADGQNRQLLNIDGLAGYVLGGQTIAWDLSAGRNGPASAVNAVTISAVTDAGPINASATAGKNG